MLQLNPRPQVQFNTINSVLFNLFFNSFAQPNYPCLPQHRGLLLHLLPKPLSQLLRKPPLLRQPGKTNGEVLIRMGILNDLK